MNYIWEKCFSKETFEKMKRNMKVGENVYKIGLLKCNEQEDKAEKRYILFIKDAQMSKIHQNMLNTVMTEMHHFIPIRMTIMKKIINNRGVENLTCPPPIHCWWAC